MLSNHGREIGLGARRPLGLPKHETRAPASPAPFLGYELWKQWDTLESQGGKDGMEYDGYGMPDDTAE